MIEDFVSDVINKHIVRYNLLFGFVISSEIRKYVKEGVYAFQLIYNENQQVILVKPLDWTKVLSTLDCWSYDGGKNFKYSSIETLKLDIQKIRELKLDKILA
jgi:hypothetical protein